MAQEPFGGHRASGKLKATFGADLICAARAARQNFVTAEQLADLELIKSGMRPGSCCIFQNLTSPPPPPIFICKQ